MDTLVSSMIEFVRVRQLNIAVAALLTIIYVVYQYWGLLFKGEEEDEADCRHPTRLSRSRSRSGSRSKSRSGYNNYKLVDSKHGRRGRKPHRRCSNCSLCNLEQ